MKNHEIIKQYNGYTIYFSIMDIKEELFKISDKELETVSIILHQILQSISEIRSQHISVTLILRKQGNDKYWIELSFNGNLIHFTVIINLDEKVIVLENYDAFNEFVFNKNLFIYNMKLYEFNEIEFINTAIGFKF
jgi:hypothetical protein